MQLLFFEKQIYTYFCAVKKTQHMSASKITMSPDGKLQVPQQPIIPFIEGDGIGPDIWKASVRVFDAAIEKAYKGERKISWM